MEWDVTELSVAGEFTLRVRFKDGLEGLVCFLPSFFRGVFAHLRDSAEFQRVMLVDGGVTWPGELDVAPDAMHEQIRHHGKWLLA
jgi:hypothetical protein